MSLPQLDRLAPRRRPAGPPAGFQEWRRLLFLHWPVAPEQLRPLVPASLDLDLWQGQAWVSLVPFVVQAARPPGAPPAVGLTFLETNVRTYVLRAGGEPGVYFFSLDAASLLATLGARVSFGLPYFWATGEERRPSDDEIDYRLERLPERGAGVQAQYRIGESLGTAEPGTLDFFLVERYLLHVQRGPTFWTVQVHHHPYPLRRVQSATYEDTLMTRAGLPAQADAPLAHFSPGVDVAIYPPRIRLVAR